MRGESRATRVRRVCREYFERCDREGRRYTVAGLKLALEVDEALWQEMLGEKGVKSILEMALSRIRDSLEQREDRMAVVQLGQPEFNGKGKAAVLEGKVKVVFGDGEDVGVYGG